jgi:hypothetical protein
LSPHHALLFSVSPTSAGGASWVGFFCPCLLLTESLCFVVCFVAFVANSAQVFKTSPVNSSERSKYQRPSNGPRMLRLPSLVIGWIGQLLFGKWRRKLDHWSVMGWKPEAKLVNNKQAEKPISIDELWEAH